MSVTLEQVLMLRYRANVVHEPGQVDSAISSSEHLEASVSVLDTLHEALSLDFKSTITKSSSRLRQVESAAAWSNLHHHTALHPDYFIKLLLTMRGEEGVRIANVERNLRVGWGKASELALNLNQLRDDLENNKVDLDADRKALRQPNRRGAEGKFAFNALQWAVLPVLYRPPMRCIGSLIT
jgi:hypothetical protein